MRSPAEYIRLPGGGKSHFKCGEFTRSVMATDFGIDNTPDVEHWLRIDALVANVLEPVRRKFGPIRITSGYRSVELCKLVGSSSKSNHTRGEAADIKPLSPGVALFDVLAWIHKNCAYRELIAEYFPWGWVHVAYREGANVKALKLKDRIHNFTRVSLDEIRRSLPA